MPVRVSRVSLAESLNASLIALERSACVFVISSRFLPRALTVSEAERIRSRNETFASSDSSFFSASWFCAFTASSRVFSTSPRAPSTAFTASLRFLASRARPSLGSSIEVAARTSSHAATAVAIRCSIGVRVAEGFGVMIRLFAFSTVMERVLPSVAVGSAEGASEDGAVEGDSFFDGSAEGVAEADSDGAGLGASEEGAADGEASPLQDEAVRYPRRCSTCSADREPPRSVDRAQSCSASSWFWALMEPEPSTKSARAEAARE